MKVHCYIITHLFLPFCSSIFFIICSSVFFFSFFLLFLCYSVFIFYFCSSVFLIICSFVTLS